MQLTVKEIAALFGIVKEEESSVTNVEFDSRLIESGGLFVPLAGTHDGHEFVEAAIANGAIATFWSHDLKTAPAEITVIPVPDTKLALQKLAQYYKEKVAPKVVGITGSNGKTTTKDMTAAVLAQKFKTYKTQGNYNNDIGMPYTILHMPEDCEMLVLEMGMDHAGEITVLSQLAHPDAAAITLIGEAHIEQLGSRQGIAKAKMEIVKGLAKNGLLLIPEDEPLLMPFIPSLTQTVQTFGFEKGTISATIVGAEKDRTLFRIADKTYEIPVLGSYNVKNALIAYGLGRYFGLESQMIARGLAHFQLTKNRTEWLKAANGADILSDVYNANPTAMKLVLDSFANVEVCGRRLAVLADMRELGSDSASMHAAVAAHIGTEYAEIFLYGEKIEALGRELLKKGQNVHYFSSDQKAELILAVKKALHPDDSIVLKGSNAMGLSQVVEALL